MRTLSATPLMEDPVCHPHLVINGEEVTNSRDWIIARPVTCSPTLSWTTSNNYAACASTTGTADIATGCFDGSLVYSDGYQTWYGGGFCTSETWITMHCYLRIVCFLVRLPAAHAKQFESITKRVIVLRCGHSTTASTIGMRLAFIVL